MRPRQTGLSDQRQRAAARFGSNGLWVATLIALAVMVLGGVGLALLAPSLTGALDNTGRLIVGLGLTIVPALLWLLFFYQQDRLEPEPHHFVLGVFMLGILLGGAVEQPLTRDVFQTTRWMEPGTLTYLLAATLLNGILTASLAYAAVRYTVMTTNEFDEPVDGIIYATAASLGLGVAANLGYLADNGTISLGVGAVQIVITSLAYATFGAVLGYFLGLVRPGGGPAFLVPIGVLAAGFLQGLYQWVETQLGRGGLSYSPWPSLIATAVFAALAFGLVFVLIGRSYNAAAARAARGA
jgi:RsiW-degrading membrane proteinase PrsW (M82 family)